jgi:ABC-type Fe3+ transport system permease subunit
MGQVEADRPGDAAAVSMVLMVSSLALLAIFDLIRRRVTRYEEPT